MFVGLMCALTCVLLVWWVCGLADLFPQSAMLDLNPRLQDSLVMGMKLAVSPDTLIHGHEPTDSTQIIAVESKWYVLASAVNSSKTQYVSRFIMAAKLETKNKSYRFRSTFVFRHFKVKVSRTSRQSISHTGCVCGMVIWADLLFRFTSSSWGYKGGQSENALNNTIYIKSSNNKLILFFPL